MTTAEVVATVLAVATAARFSFPLLDRWSVGPRLPSALQGAGSGTEGSAGGDGSVSWGGGRSASSGRGSSSPLRIQQALLSLLRRVFPFGRLGVRRSRRPRAMQRKPEEERAIGKRIDKLHPPVSWNWPITCDENSTTGPDSEDYTRVLEKKNQNPRYKTIESDRGSDRTITMAASTKTQESRVKQIPLSYPRPRSTAYPRPRVSAPTLLDFDADEQPSASPYPKKGASEKGSGNPMLGDFLCRFFARMITKRARLVEGLEVHVDARNNREAMSGLLQEVGITFNHLELENLRISGGAIMAIRGLDLKVLTLLWRRFRSFKKPFEVSGSYVFTSEDLATSPMVRRLVESMMNATLRKLETYATNPLSLRKSLINISQVTAKRSRLVIDGDMVYDNARVPFNYRTSIGVRREGHVVYLKGSEVFWENVGGSLSLPLVPLQTFDVDIGDHARVESIRIVNGQVAVRTRFVLSPFPPLVVASTLKRAALRYDVGEKLSVIFDNLIQNMKIF